LPEYSAIAKNPFEEALWSEWKKMKSGKARKEKEVNSLSTKMDELKEELLKERKECTRVKT
jgi:hypothetical protein